MHLRTYRDGDILREELRARPAERVRELGGALDVHEFATGTRVLETGDVEVLRVLDWRIEALQDRGVEALRATLARPQLELPRDVELHTRMNGPELQELVRAGEHADVTLDMGIGTLEPGTLSYALIMGRRRVLVRTLPEGVITRLWVDGLHLRREQWGMNGIGHETGPLHGYIDLTAEQLLFRDLGAHPRRAGRATSPPASRPVSQPGEHHAVA